jgi:hypothetical protein
MTERLLVFDRSFGEVPERPDEEEQGEPYRNEHEQAE